MRRALWTPTRGGGLDRFRGARACGFVRFACCAIVTGAGFFSGAPRAAGSAPNQHHEPFTTFQPGVGPITLTFQGDALFNWYEDADGYTVLFHRGRYYYAALNGDGALVPTSHRVGEVVPAAVGLMAGTLPTVQAIAGVRAAASLDVAFDPPGEPVIPANTTLIDGCIVVPNAIAPAGDAGGSLPQSGTHLSSWLWPDGIVPYTFDSTVNATNQQRMRDAMDAWEAVANVKFIPRTNETAYIEVISGNGNWSYVGKVGGKQQLCMYNWTYQFIIMHELAHALGVWHEQSRPDRGAYIEIETDNISAGSAHNFDIQADASTSGSYDFDSIMHYGQCAFSVCACSTACRTITVKSPYEAWQAQIGQRSHLSIGDVATMEGMYGAPADGDAAEMSAPESDGDLIDDDTFTFKWTAGTNVTSYQLLVGTSVGDDDIHDYKGTATKRTVTGLPTDGSMIHVTLKSEIDGDWTARYYVYSHGEDICPGSSDLVDADEDGVPDGCDVCPGADDTIDTDEDGAPDCLDECPTNPEKSIAGDCGCDEVDTDADGTPDCEDGCPNDPQKIAAGICGCGNDDADTDGDGTPDCNDLCPLDPLKISPGICGCGAQVRSYQPGQRDFECDDGTDGGDSADGGDDDRGIDTTPVISVSVCGAGGAALMMTAMMLAGPMWVRRRRRYSSRVRSGGGRSNAGATASGVKTGSR